MNVAQTNLEEPYMQKKNNQSKSNNYYWLWRDVTFSIVNHSGLQTSRCALQRNIL